MAEQKRTLWSPIVTAGDALSAIKDSTRFLFIVAGAAALASVWRRNYWSLIDNGVVVGLALWVRRSKTKVGAVLLFAFSVLQLAFSVSDILVAGSDGLALTFSDAARLFFVVAVSGVASRTVKATGLLKKLSTQPSGAPARPPQVTPGQTAAPPASDVPAAD